MFIFILLIFILVLVLPFKENFQQHQQLSTKDFGKQNPKLSDLDVLLKVNECQNGCLDKNGLCYFGANSVCRFNNVCYAFYDQNGKLKTPCDTFDRYNKNLFQDCNNCRYCRLCIDGNKKQSCISQKDFSCYKCPYSDGCAADIFSLTNSEQQNT